MEEVLTLFNVEDQHKEYELGKSIWDIYETNPQLSLMNIFKQLNIENDFLGRRAYWSYVMLEKCELKKNLKKRNKEYLLNGIKNYIYINYCKLLKAKIGTPSHINKDFKEYICDFFIATCKLPEKDLRIAINDEVKKINSDYENLDFIDEEKNLMRAEIKSLNKQINDLQKENYRLNEKLENSYENIYEIGNKIKKDILNANKIYLMFVVIISMVLATVSK